MKKRVKEGTGLTLLVFAIGTALSWPPGTWAEMPSLLVHFGYVLWGVFAAWGIALILVGWAEDKSGRGWQAILAGWHHAMTGGWRWFTFVTSTCLVLVVGNIWDFVAPQFSDNLYVSFDYPNFHEILSVSHNYPINFRFINGQRAPVSIENVTLMELFKTYDDPYVELSHCNDSLQAYRDQDAMNPPGAEPLGMELSNELTHESKNSYLISSKPHSVTVDGHAVQLPITLASGLETVAVNFKILTDRATKPFYNGSYDAVVLCPTIKFYDMHGVASVAICKGIVFVRVLDRYISRDQPMPLPDGVQAFTHSHTANGIRTLDTLTDIYYWQPKWFQLTPKSEFSSPLAG